MENSLPPAIDQLDAKKPSMNLSALLLAASSGFSNIMSSGEFGT
jgi:hypothetical protein